MRKLKLKLVEPREDHVNVLKWREELAGVPPTKELWRNMWLPFCQENINCLLWQVALQIPSMKHYVYNRGMADDQEEGEIVPQNDERTWCERCPLKIHEDLLHLLWHCPESERIWNWVKEMMIATGNLKESFLFNAAQALLGAKIVNAGKTFPYKLWEVIRGHTVWEIWLSRDRLHFDKQEVSFQEVVYNIWSVLRQYVKIDWDVLEGKVAKQLITLEDAVLAITFDFGNCKQFFTVNSDGIRIEYQPINIIQN
jgi:hypothetical protein